MESIFGGPRSRFGFVPGVAECHYLMREATNLPVGFAWLSPRERETLAGLRFSGRRRDWLVGRWTGKLAVAARLERRASAMPLDQIEIVAAGDGAPEVLVAERPAPFRISLSHRAGRALCVVTAADMPVGCDLERIEPHDEALAEDFFTPDECELVARASGTERDLLVALLWSAKESALKLLREGLRADTRSVAIELGGDPVAGGWAPLATRCEEAGSVFHGWWQRAGDLVLTVVAARRTAPPIEIGARAKPLRPARLAPLTTGAPSRGHSGDSGR